MKTMMLQVRVTPEFYQAVQQAAKRRQTTLSAYTLEALRDKMYGHQLALIDAGHLSSVDKSPVDGAQAAV